MHNLKFSSLTISCSTFNSHKSGYAIGKLETTKDKDRYYSIISSLIDDFNFCAWIDNIDESNDNNLYIKSCKMSDVDSHDCDSDCRSSSSDDMGIGKYLYSSNENIMLRLSGVSVVYIYSATIVLDGDNIDCTIDISIEIKNMTPFSISTKQLSLLINDEMITVDGGIELDASDSVIIPHINVHLKNGIVRPFLNLEKRNVYKSYYFSNDDTELMNESLFGYYRLHYLKIKVGDNITCKSNFVMINGTTNVIIPYVTTNFIISINKINDRYIIENIDDNESQRAIIQLADGYWNVDSNKFKDARLFYSVKFDDSCDNSDSTLVSFLVGELSFPLTISPKSIPKDSVSSSTGIAPTKDGCGTADNRSIKKR